MSLLRHGLTGALLASVVACTARSSDQADGETGTGDGSTATASTDGASGDGTDGTSGDGTDGTSGNGTDGTSGDHEACVEQQKLPDSQPEVGAYFGSSASASGDTIVVGGSGFANVYVRDQNGGWDEQQSALVGAGMVEGLKRLDSLVSMDGDTIVAFAGDDGPDGPWNDYVFVFERSSGDWPQVAELVPPYNADTNPATHKGLAVSGEAIVVGDPSDPHAGESSGAAHVFERDAGGAWVATQTLTASDAAERGGFGFSVAASSDTIAVGTTQPAGWGAVYVFAREQAGTWNEVSKLTKPDGPTEHSYGTSVAISGDALVVGVRDGSPPYASGSAYVFERDETGHWGLATELSPSDDGEVETCFGSDVAISGDMAVVGAPAEAGGGSAYVFVRDQDGQWSERAKLTGSDTDVGDQFGGAVAMSGSTVVVGAPNIGDAELDPRGGAYVFDCL